jgi:hypothetical protein
MVVEQVGRLPVVTRESPRTVIGIVTRSDLLAAHAPRLRAAHTRATPLGVRLAVAMRRKRRSRA